MGEGTGDGVEPVDTVGIGWPGLEKGDLVTLNFGAAPGAGCAGGVNFKPDVPGGEGGVGGGGGGVGADMKL